MNKSKRLGVALLWLSPLLLLLLIGEVSEDERKSQEIAYSEFTALLDRRQVKDLVVTENTVRGERWDGKQWVKFSTNRVDPELAPRLEQSGVTYKAEVEQPSAWGTFFFWLPILLITWLLFRSYMAVRSGAGGLGAMSVGRSKAKVFVEKEVPVRFVDVAGVDEAKGELQEVVQFLKNPSAYGRLGARMPHGILLVGPPGTGKTMLAKAVAGEAGVPFFSITGSEFVELFVGVGAARVRDLFAQAREHSPSIIFIDELDALGRSRISAGVGAGNDEKEQTLNQLLSELDGFDTREGVVLLAATNRPEILDPALLRSGRFDRQILVDRPDRKGRVDILKVHVRKVRLDTDANLDDIAALTPGFTGADLANLVNEAALIATRRNASSVTKEDFTYAMERIVAGLEKRKRVMTAKERTIVAYHEMGHALVSAAFPVEDKVHKVSIIPRGIGSLGYTIRRPTEDRFLMTKAELENKMAMLLGGRAAEELVFGEASTGAADDIMKATDIAHSMVAEYGMESLLGPVAYDTDTQGVQPGSSLFLGQTQSWAHGDITQREIDQAVRNVINTAFHRATRVLRENRAVLVEGASLLLEKETLSETELLPLFEKIKVPEPEGGGFKQAF